MVEAGFNSTRPAWSGNGLAELPS